MRHRVLGTAHLGAALQCCSMPVAGVTGAAVELRTGGGTCYARAGLLPMRQQSCTCTCTHMSRQRPGVKQPTSTHLASRSCSEAPGNKGRPRKSSAATQPKDHMSMALLYSQPSTTSGER